MVCPRCIKVVSKTLKEMGYELNDVELGVVKFHDPVSIEDKKAIEDQLRPYGFEILEDKKTQLIDRIKAQVIELVSKDVNTLTITLSEYLASKLQMEYDVLSRLFSLQETQTIEHFYIQQKIEKVKELLVYTDLTLNEIAFNLNYSSVAHLSNQFKKITGLTPSFFKEIKEDKNELLNRK